MLLLSSFLGLLLRSKGALKGACLVLLASKPRLALIADASLDSGKVHVNNNGPKGGGLRFEEGRPSSRGDEALLLAVPAPGVGRSGSSGFTVFIVVAHEGPALWRGLPSKLSFLRLSGELLGVCVGVGLLLESKWGPADQKRVLTSISLIMLTESL